MKVTSIYRNEETVLKWRQFFLSLILDNLQKKLKLIFAQFIHSFLKT